MASSFRDLNTHPHAEAETHERVDAEAARLAAWIAAQEAKHGEQHD